MNLQEIRETVQSSHINFLMGAGLSTPFLPLLGDIERRLSNERERSNRIKIQKEYFDTVIAPNLDIVARGIEASRQAAYAATIGAYKDFFEVLGNVLLARKNTILSKQANIFTTNIDILMETALEASRLEYNDGFSGRLNSYFSLSNFKKSVLKQSLHFENISEVPTFNLMKMHGSLTWEKAADKISFSKLTHFDRSLLTKEDGEFEDGYNQLAIVNPEKRKFEQTVIDLTYYELLRMYSTELEKENVALFVMGCSMEDEHIREITLRAANSNPTLKIYLFCHSGDTDSKMKTKMEIGTLRYGNINVVEPEDDSPSNRFGLAKVNEIVFQGMVKNMMNGDEE